MWYYILGGAAALILGDKVVLPWYKKNHAGKKVGGVQLPGSPLPPGATLGSGGATGITPPGKPQPPGTVVIPPPTAMSDNLHNTAAALVQFIQRSPPDSMSHPEVKAFQNAWNTTAPLVPLQEDGKYGAKTQAAVQGVIDPAQAPTNWFPPKAGNVTVPGPTNPAPPPVKNVDVWTAASTLVGMGTVPKASNANVTTFQHAYNQHAVSAYLAEDGKYGPLSQAALQSVLNTMGGGVAPTNPYGPPKTSIPTFPDSPASAAGGGVPQNPGWGQ